MTCLYVWLFFLKSLFHVFASHMKTLHKEQLCFAKGGVEQQFAWVLLKIRYLSFMGNSSFRKMKGKRIPGASSAALEGGCTSKDIKVNQLKLCVVTLSNLMEAQCANSPQR